MNKKILESNPAEKGLFDILVLSNNSPESGVRIINSAKHYGKVAHPWGYAPSVLSPQHCIHGEYRARGKHAETWGGEGVLQGGHSPITDFAHIPCPKAWRFPSSALSVMRTPRST